MPIPTALVIDEDHRLGDTLVDLLTIFNLRCAYSPSSDSARQQINELKPDLVLFDLPFYNRSGLELLTEIRLDLRLRHTKIIVIATDEYSDTVELHLADAVLLKPFSFDLLEATISRLLDYEQTTDGGEHASISSPQP